MVRGTGAGEECLSHIYSMATNAQSHSPSQPPLITALTSEGTEAGTYICFRHDLEIVRTVKGKTVMKLVQ